MTEKLISQYQTMHSITLPQQLIDETLSLFGEKSEDFDAVKEFIDSQLILDVTDERDYLKYYVIQRLIMIFLIYVLLLILASAIYLVLGYNMTDIFDTMLMTIFWAPTLLIEFIFIAFTYKKLINTNITINYIQERQNFKKLFTAWIGMAVMFIAINFLTSSYFPWFVFALSGATGSFSSSYIAIKYFNKFNK